MDDATRVKYLIANNDFMTIATADLSGKPWISPVGFIADDKYDLFWVSTVDSLHSENIKRRPEVAIVIVGKLPDGTTDGVYFDAVAKEIEDNELDKAIKLLSERPKDPKFDITSKSQVTGKAIWRIYKANPVSVSKRTDQTLNGQAITVRKPVEL